MKLFTTALRVDAFGAKPFADIAPGSFVYIRVGRNPLQFVRLAKDGDPAPHFQMIACGDDKPLQLVAAPKEIEQAVWIDLPPLEIQLGDPVPLPDRLEEHRGCLALTSLGPAICGFWLEHGGAVALDSWVTLRDWRVQARLPLDHNTPLHRAWRLGYSRPNGAFATVLAGPDAGQ